MITESKSNIKRNLAVMILVSLIGIGLMILSSYINDLQTNLSNAASWKPFVLFLITALLSGFTSKGGKNE